MEHIYSNAPEVFATHLLGQQHGILGNHHTNNSSLQGNTYLSRSLFVKKNFTSSFFRGRREIPGFPRNYWGFLGNILNVCEMFFFIMGRVTDLDY